MGCFQENPTQLHFKTNAKEIKKNYILILYPILLQASLTSVTIIKKNKKNNPFLSISNFLSLLISINISKHLITLDNKGEFSNILVYVSLQHVFHITEALNQVIGLMSWVFANDLETEV